LAILYPDKITHFGRGKKKAAATTKPALELLPDYVVIKLKVELD
jgi:hypothetical protein